MTLDCVVLQESAQTVVVKYAKGTITLDKSAIDSIEKTPEAQPGENQRFASLNGTIKRVAQQAWATEFRQAKSFVIDKGVLRLVPYQSFSFGGAFEFNIYGDPEDPAGIEFGIVRESKQTVENKNRCIELACEVLLRGNDAAIVRQLDLKESKAEREGLTFEVTPPTADDSYGGWWISVYNMDALDKNRVPEQQVPELTEEVEAPQKKEPSKDLATQRPEARREETLSPASPDSSDRNSRRPSSPSLSSGSSRTKASKPSSISSSPSYSGRVWVKSYYRKDGTFVRGHSRKR